jgi:hypothetical protein
MQNGFGKRGIQGKFSLYCCFYLAFNVQCNAIGALFVLSLYTAAADLPLCLTGYFYLELGLALVKT